MTQPTFRDPAGTLTLEENRAVRRIAGHAREEALAFLGSAFCSRAQERGDLIGAKIEDGSEGLRLVHPRIAIPTYPWEWTASQWLVAAQLTLRLGREALAEGWILKDATPLNVLFVGTRPVLVDILSFARREEGDPIWLAYGQYVRTFLLPLLALRLLDWPLELTLFRRDGYEPTDLYAAVGLRQRLMPALLGPVTLPVLLERKDDGKTQRKPARRLPADAATAVLAKTMEDLERRTKRAVPDTGRSQWSEYGASLSHYTAEQSRDKRDRVQSWLEGIRPAEGPFRVLDVGANTGEFSALAASLGAEVTALERDAAAADRLYRMSRENSQTILTVHADLARPTPAVGWENAESASLLERLEERFDALLMLAVIHHLILMEQIPLPRIVGLMHRLTRRHCVVEWVPVSDRMFQSLMRGRDELYGSLSEDDLTAACSGMFRTMERHTLGNGRVLLLLERIG